MNPCSNSKNGQVSSKWLCDYLLQALKDLQQARQSAQDVTAFFQFAYVWFEQSAKELFGEIQDVHIFQCAVRCMERIALYECDSHPTVTEAKLAEGLISRRNVVIGSGPLVEEARDKLQEQTIEWILNAETREKTRIKEWRRAIVARVPPEDFETLRIEFEKHDRAPFEFNWAFLPTVCLNHHLWYPGLTGVLETVPKGNFTALAVKAARVFGYEHEYDWLDMLRLYKFSSFRFDGLHPWVFERYPGLSYEGAILDQVVLTSESFCRSFEAEVQHVNHSLLYPNHPSTDLMGSELHYFPHSPRNLTPLTPPLSRKGDYKLLEGKKSVSFATAEAYLGLSDRRRQQLVSTGKLTQVGGGQNRKITAESLLEYLPEENPQRSEATRKEAK